MYLVFSSGGTLGLNMLGALLAYETLHPGLYDGVQGCCGCSIGALLAAGVSAGLRASEMYDELLQLDWSRMRVEAKPRCILERFGLDSHDAIRYLVCTILRKAGLADGVTFAEAYRLTRRQLACCVADLTNMRRLYVDRSTHPDLPVADAVVASMCVPLLFEPYKLGDALCVDGGLVEVTPVSYFALEASVVFRVAEGDGAAPDNWRRYVKALLTINAHILERAVDMSRARELVDVARPAGFDALDFSGLNVGGAQALVAAGFAGCMQPRRPQFAEAVGRLVHLVHALHSQQHE